MALEDIQEGTGELEYYAGCRRSPDYLFGGYSKWVDVNPSEHDRFLKRLHEDATDYVQKKALWRVRAMCSFGTPISPTAAHRSPKKGPPA